MVKYGGKGRDMSKPDFIIERKPRLASFVLQLQKKEKSC